MEVRGMNGGCRAIGVMHPEVEMDLLGRTRPSHLVQAVREMGVGVEEIDLEIGAGDDDASFAHAAHALAVMSPEDQQDESQDTSLQHSQLGGVGGPPRKKKRVVKKWRDEWADTYKWAYVAVMEGTPRIFCSICKEYGRKHRRNPYGNEGSRNMQMSALEEHNNSLLHKEALRLQVASKDKGITLFERPIYIKTLLSKSAESIIEAVIRRDPHEGEFIQAVQEVVHSLEPVLSKNQQYMHVLESLLEPDRVIVFRVPWLDDKGEKHINRGFRVQFNQALGPYKGGMRFHPCVNLSVLKFLGFEQTLKHALTTFSFGGAEGGSDFDPRHRSDLEMVMQIMRFCQSFMDELYRYIGPSQDTLTGDIGVGSKELGYLYGQYRRLTGQYDCALTGGINALANSNLHAEAAAHGMVYYAKHLFSDLNRELKGLRCLVSGAGKLALHVVEKLVSLGAIVMTVSDSKGYLLDDDGFDHSKLGTLKEIRSQQKGLREYMKRYPRGKYYDEAKPWNERCDVAFPCATQNEINHSDALALISAGCQVIIEGADMPCTAEAVDVLRKSKIFVAPSKAANAGGVAVSGLEIANKGNGLLWSAEEVDAKLQELMRDIYQKSMSTANACGFGKGNPEALVHGANIASFLRVAQAMLEQGVV
ncbi:hypothetical protein O6H91_03G001100 [Diphasiastrum complanatum]|uniref:Uncharacterized protein n=1 Tax=Diphasiastrum complanatum TaxID=34168 RepID=A0ACC2E2R7_DIPCM|nr:hypothetical protein O6H91_03G001100 [Diphasiastrum complanatum]